RAVRKFWRLQPLLAKAGPGSYATTLCFGPACGTAFRVAPIPGALKYNNFFVFLGNSFYFFL
ncbi:hypothetical protein, partial [Leptospira borgpetersenii]